MGLTTKQQFFISHYLANGGNGVQAAGSAGYKGNVVTLASVAKENLRKPLILAEIEMQQKEMQTKLRATAMNKRELLWSIAMKGVSITIDQVGNKVMKDPRSAIAAIAELNKMDGDHATKKVDLTQTYVNQYDELDQKLL